MRNRITIIKWGCNFNKMINRELKYLVILRLIVMRVCRIFIHLEIVKTLGIIIKHNRILLISSTIITSVLVAISTFQTQAKHSIRQSISKRNHIFPFWIVIYWFKRFYTNLSSEISIRMYFYLPFNFLCSKNLLIN